MMPPKKAIASVKYVSGNFPTTLDFRCGKWVKYSTEAPINISIGLD